jgi:hypothetical protein
MATTRPAAVVMSASEMPGATARRVAVHLPSPRPWKASMMPHDGAEGGRRRERRRRWWPARSCAAPGRVRASEEAIWAARSRASGLRGMPRPPDWRRYSSLISVKTGTSGLGRNWSEMAAISLRRPELRKARRKRLLCAWARRKLDHLVSMTVQEKMLAARRMMRTAKANGPELWIISTSALLEAPTGGAEASS